MRSVGSAAGALVSTLDFSGRFVSVEEKRKALKTTGDTQAGEIALARKALGEAFAELKKLDHLVAINRRADAVRQQRAQAAAVDDGVAMWRARR